jgi:hypothetical protein
LAHLGGCWLRFVDTPGVRVRPRNDCRCFTEAGCFAHPARNLRALPQRHLATGNPAALRILDPGRKLFWRIDPGEDLHQLASQLEAIWTDPATSTQLKKRIARTLIEEVLVDVDGSQAELILTVHWKGGVHSRSNLHSALAAPLSNRSRHSQPFSIIAWIEAIFMGFRGPEALLNLHGCGLTPRAISLSRTPHEFQFYSTENCKLKFRAMAQTTLGLSSDGDRACYRCDL